MRARMLRELSALVLGALLLLTVTPPAHATHPATLPDTITTPAPTYTIHYTNDNPYAPPAIATSDLNYLPTAQAQAIANALVNSNAPTPGNPNGYHTGYVNLGFLAPAFGGNPRQVFAFDCDPHGGCDTANAGSDRINFNADLFVGGIEPFLRVVAGHELFHEVQYTYLGGGSGGWGGMPIEGTARMLQDDIYSDLDANSYSGGGSFRSQAGGYLGSTNVTLWSVDYPSSLWWKYLSEQLGGAAAEPNVGVDVILRWWQNAQAIKSTPDVMGTTRTTITNFRPGETLENLFHDFTIANYAKGFDLSLVPNASRYRYVDENDGVSGSYGNVTKAWSGTIPPQQGPTASSAVSWGAQYYEATIDTTVGGNNPCRTGVAGFLSDGGVAAYGLVALKGNQVQQILRARTGHFARAFLQRPLSPYTKLGAIVAGLSDNASFTYTFGCGAASIAIEQPDSTLQAFVGTFDAPERFLIRTTVTGPANLGTPSVEGLSASDFQVFVGPEAPANQAPVLSAARVQGEWWIVAQAPTKVANGTFDLLVKLGDVASATNPNAVRYELRILDQVLVIDRSGSMADPVGSPKIDAAKNAATLFVDAAGSQDEIGSVSFAGDNVEPNDDASLDRMLAAVSDPQRAATKTAIGLLGAGGLTSIGDGLDKGRSELAIRGSALGEDWLVLLSDGMQNEAKFWTDVKGSIQAAGIKVNAIALGPLTDQALLQTIANDTGGIYYYVDVGTAAAAFAAEAAGDTATSLAAPSSGPLPNRLGDAYEIGLEHTARLERLWEQSGTAGVAQVYDVNVAEGGIEEARFSFNWSSAADVLNASVQRPDGTFVTDGVLGARIFTNATHRVFHVGDLTPGTWRVTLSAGVGAPQYLGILSGRNRQGASLDVWFGEYHPDAIAKSLNGLFLRGLPMPILATLTDRNGPVLGANVEATIQHPDGTLILLPLLDDGSHGDGDANDGIYANSYTRTTAFSLSNLPDSPSSSGNGSYPVRVEASGTDSVSQPFFRIRKAAFQVFETNSQTGLPSDSDNDGMPNRYEVLHACLNQFIGDPGLDPDSDGLTNLDEWNAGTDPCDPDTDRGGESDRSELVRGANVFDPRDDALPRPEDVQVIELIPDHVPLAQPLLPNSNLIRFPVNAAYAALRLYSSTSPTGPFAPVATWAASAYPGLYRDAGLLNFVTYYYRLVALDLAGNESAPSGIFSGTPKPDPTPPIGFISIDRGAAYTESVLASLDLGGDPDIALMRLANGPLAVLSAPWQALASPIGWLLAPDATTNLATVYVQYMDAAGNVGAVYADSIPVVPAGTLGGVTGTVLLAGVAAHDGTIALAPPGAPAFTNVAGGFSISGLLPGTYDVHVEHTGYTSATVAGVVVPAGGTVSIGTLTLVGDVDGDGVADSADNCPTTPNPGQENFDADMNGDACDSCETLVDLGTDTDMDGVDDACDTCRLIANPPIAGSPTANRSFISHQRDDDTDGRGNRCDFDYNNAGPVLTSTDFNDMKFSLLPSPGLMTASNCGATVGSPPAGEGGSGANQRCGEFDHDEVGPTVTAADYNLAKAAIAAGGVIDTNFPKCSACTQGTGWSNVVGPGARINRPVCQSAVAGACVYAP